MFNNVRLIGFERGMESAQFQEEMAGHCQTLKEIARDGIRRARASATSVFEVLGIRTPSYGTRDIDRVRQSIWDKASYEAVSVQDIAVLLRGEYARRGHENALRRKAKSIGLAYWPALRLRGVDPAAFVAAERVLCRTHGLYGETLDDGSRSRGGWDSQGHYGLSPESVRSYWFSAGCRDNAKFRWQVAHQELIRKGVTLHDHLMRKRAQWWLSHTPWRTTYLTRGALRALARVSPWARWTALRGIGTWPESQSVVRLKDLDWAEVGRLQGKRAWQRAQHCPKGLQWQMIHGVDRPAGLDAFDVIGFPMKAYRELCEAAGIDPYNGERDQEVRRPLANLAILFGSFGEVARFAQMQGVPMDRIGLHNLGQFVTPEVDRSLLPAWRRLVFKSAEVLSFVALWPQITAQNGAAVPESPREAIRMATMCRYTGIESQRDQDVAEMAAHLKLSDQQFHAYRDLCRNPVKASETIPHVRVEGHEVGLEGDWVLRTLEAGDPMGPALGLLTACCQHAYSGPIRPPILI
ncbi:MAG: hypothetical protein EOM22_10330 [Gammaproteobacteria bacterium]|nr:hypothetical protein [Gammaproteobacteria bacterium]